MDNSGAYVWLTYGLTCGFWLGISVWTFWRRRRIFRRLRQFHHRQQQLAGHQLVLRKHNFKQTTAAVTSEKSSSRVS